MSFHPPQGVGSSSGLGFALLLDFLGVGFCVGPPALHSMSYKCLLHLYTFRTSVPGGRFRNNTDMWFQEVRMLY